MLFRKFLIFCCSWPLDEVIRNNSSIDFLKEKNLDFGENIVGIVAPARQENTVNHMKDN